MIIIVWSVIDLELHVVPVLNWIKKELHEVAIIINVILQHQLM